MKFAPYVALSLLCWQAIACESTAEPKRAPAAAVHPDFPVPPSPEMIAQSELGLPDAGAAKPAPKKDWNASCLARRGCALKEQPIRTCETSKPVPTWSDLQRDADAFVGKVVEVSGSLGLAPAQSTKSSTPCSPGACCHSLRLGLTLDGAPLALPLQGLGCTGDDSKLCCGVPVESQTVRAHGRLVKAPAGSTLNWQLAEATLCLPQTPEEAREH